MERKLYLFPEGCAVCEDGKLTEYISLNEETQSGDIILAKVDRMMPGMECAFADIGRKKDGFLPLKENSRSFTDGPVRSGDRIAVQIRREENGEKGAYLSRDLTIPGKTVILMPKNRYIGVSNRISEEKDREKLRDLGKRISDGQFGMVLRAAAETAPEEEILAETKELTEIWNRIRERIDGTGSPGQVLYAQNPVTQLCRDYAFPEGSILHSAEIPPEIRKQIAAAGERKLKLPGGGNIVIDRCEAMTVIDVNSAAAGSSGRKEATVTGTNLEACAEAAAQIRLRDIAGIIMIDFIDMENDSDRDEVERKTREEFARDRRKTVVHGWTRLGILEITRKRI